MPDRARAVPFDVTKLRQLMNDTAALQALLAARVPQEELPVAFQSSHDRVRSTEVQRPAIDDRHNAALRELLQRPRWTLNELRTITSRLGLMPLACIAKLNEWATDNFGDVLLEGEETITVNEHLKERIES
jgi:hypothetical protein